MRGPHRRKGIQLWCRADAIATELDAWAIRGGLGDAEPTGTLTGHHVARLGAVVLALIGIWLGAHALTGVVYNLGELVFTDQISFSVPTHGRDPYRWRTALALVAGLTQLGVGIVLVTRRARIANALFGEDAPAA